MLFNEYIPDNTSGSRSFCTSYRDVLVVTTVVSSPVVVWTRRNVRFRTITLNIVQPNYSATRTDMSKSVSVIPVYNHQPQMIVINDTVYNTYNRTLVPVSQGLRTKLSERTFFTPVFSLKKLPRHVVRFLSSVYRSPMFLDFLIGPLPNRLRR